MKLDSFYDTPDSFYLVLELFRGGNLKSYIISQGPLNEIEASLLFKNVLEGLKYLHERNIMHRDIKPENILFRSDNLHLKNQIALADFGLATKNDWDRPYLFFRCGTPGYVAPEIYEAEDPMDHYGVKCDMFSLGVTLYFALTGELPYQGKKRIRKENFQICSELKSLPEFLQLSTTGKILNFLLFNFYLFMFFFFWRRLKENKLFSRCFFIKFLIIWFFLYFLNQFYPKWLISEKITLHKIAQNLLLRLVCKEETRFDVFQTLNHEFFQAKLKPLPENFDEDEMENSGTTISFSSVEQKMEAFKKLFFFEIFKNMKFN